MRYTKWFASIALAAGMAVAGTTAASAQDWRDLRHDYNRVDALRAAVSRDRARLDDDIRCGRRANIAWDRQQLARDEYALRMQSRDIRDDYRGYNNGYSNSYNSGYSNSYNNGNGAYNRDFRGSNWR